MRSPLWEPREMLSRFSFFTLSHSFSFSLSSFLPLYLFLSQAFEHRPRILFLSSKIHSKPEFSLLHSPPLSIYFAIVEFYPLFTLTNILFDNYKWNVFKPYQKKKLVNISIYSGSWEFVNINKLWSSSSKLHFYATLRLVTVTDAEWSSYTTTVLERSNHWERIASVINSSPSASHSR